MYNYPLDIEQLRGRISIIGANYYIQCFSSAGAWPMGVDFDDADQRDLYRDAQRWCRLNCLGNWRVEPDRLAREVTFHFEITAEAVLFALSFDVMK